MKLLESAIKVLAPRYALQRHIAISRLARLENGEKHARRSWEALSGDRTRYDQLATSKSADAFIAGGAKELRHHVRHLEYNNGFVSGTIQRIVDNVVGLGFNFQSRMIADTDSASPALFGRITDQDAELWNRSAERAFKAWAKQADVRLTQTFHEMARLAESEMIRSGEMLFIGRKSARTGRLIPYCLEALEIDRLQTPISQVNNPQVSNGIKYDSEGVPESYFVLRDHPGDTIRLSTWRDSEFEEVPAYNSGNGTKKVIHLFNPIRPEQSRGFSAFASALKDLQDHDRYREAEILAAIEDACLTGIVTSDNPDQTQPGWTSDDTTEVDGEGNAQRIHEFGVNQFIYLKRGEDMKMHEPKRPNAQLESFIDELLSGAANALNVPREVLTQKWWKMNYSNARTVLLQLYATCLVRQQYLVDHFCLPVYENMLADMVALGHVRPAWIHNKRREDALKTLWIPRTGRQWIDPMKEAQGKAVDLQNNMETLSNIWAMKGQDFEEAIEQRAYELKTIRNKEEKYGVKFPVAASSTAGAQPNNTDKEDEEDRALRVV